MMHTTKPSHLVLSKFFVASRESKPAHAQNEFVFPLLQKLCNKFTQSYPGHLVSIGVPCCGQPTFFGFLRVGEMTVPSLDAYDPSVHLSLGDVALDSRTAPTIVWLTIKQSKTDPFRKGAKLCLGRTESAVCPIKALLSYLAIWKTAPGPLFISENGVPLTRAHFKTLLSATLKKAGLDDSKYNTHSFRIGAATSAKAVGISDMHIQLLGRWKSSAFQGYIKTPTHILTELSK